MAPDVSLLTPEILDSLYAATAYPDEGAAFLRRMAELFRANTASFLTYDHRSRTGVLRMDYGCTERFRRDVCQWVQHSPWVPKIEEFRSTGGYSGVLDDEVPLSELRKSVFYKEIFPPHDIEWCGASIVFGPPGIIPGLLVTRPKSDPPFGAAEKQLLRELLPHFRRTFQLARRVASITAHGSAAQYALDLIGAATVCVNPAGKFLSMNRRAESLLAGGAQLKINNERLCTAVASEQSALDACIAPACNFGSGHGLDPGDGAVVLHSPTGAPLYVSVIPFRFGWTLLDDVPAALVFLTPAEEQINGGHRLWAMMFGLTPAECRVAEMMKQAMDVTEIAEKMRVRADTVRYYQKCVYRKTRVRGQRELMRLLTRLPSPEI